MIVNPDKFQAMTLESVESHELVIDRTIMKMSDHGKVIHIGTDSELTFESNLSKLF